MPKRSRSTISKQVQVIRRSLTAIERSIGRLVALTSSPASGSTPARHKLKLSAERQAALKLQGQYMGYLRNLKPRQKAEVKALRTKKGPRQAVALARRLAKG